MNGDNKYHRPDHVPSSVQPLITGQEKMSIGEQAHQAVSQQHHFIERKVSSDVALSDTSDQGDYYWSRPFEIGAAFIALLLAAFIGPLGILAAVIIFVFAAMRRSTWGMIICAIALIVGIGSIVYSISSSLYDSYTTEIVQSNSSYSDNQGLSYKYPDQLKVVADDESSGSRFIDTEDDLMNYSVYRVDYRMSDLVEKLDNDEDPRQQLWWNRLLPDRFNQTGFDVLVESEEPNKTILNIGFGGSSELLSTSSVSKYNLLVTVHAEGETSVVQVLEFNSIFGPSGDLKEDWRSISNSMEGLAR